MSTKYYCKACVEYIDESQVIPGETISEDEHTYDTCPSCLSPGYVAEIDEADICAHCGDWHDPEGRDARACFEELYTDALGTLYLLDSWGYEELRSHMGRTADAEAETWGRLELRQVILGEGQETEFIRYAAGRAERLGREAEGMTSAEFRAMRVEREESAARIKAAARRAG
jgi:hypothetical protein